ncbi:MAG: helix-turn-helix transcriptional regulator, partial [Pseudoclavibacter sp.]
RRDLAALSAAGVPVYSQQGRGGGWHLVGGARTDLTGLTEPESTALFALLAQTRGVPGASADAARKLLRAIPATFREGVERVVESTVRDEAPWGRQAVAAPDALAPLQRAIARGTVVSVEYRGAPAVDLAPLGLAARGEHWYLLALRRGAAIGDEPRLFRLDRIGAVVVMSERVPRDPAFDLSAAWERATSRIEGMRGAAEAIVRVEPWALEPIRHAFGVQAAVVDVADGRIRVRAQNVTALAEQLAGWAHVAVVEGPDPVRAELARIGRVLVERYE